MSIFQNRNNYIHMKKKKNYVKVNENCTVFIMFKVKKVIRSIGFGSTLIVERNT